MSYLESEEFRAKAEAHKRRAEAMREAHARSLFDAQTAETAGAMTPEAFLKALAER